MKCRGYVPRDRIKTGTISGKVHSYDLQEPDQLSKRSSWCTVYPVESSAKHGE